VDDDFISVGEAYVTTFYERLAAFRSYLVALSGETSGADPAIDAALSSFIEFADYMREQADKVTADEIDLISVLAPLLTHLRVIEQLADQLFSRGHVLALPRSLRTATTQELRNLGLHNRTPVLMIGPPQNFETFIQDLREYMLSVVDLVDIKPSDKFLSMICLPYSEGTRALWRPVTMGHELAHLAEDEHGIVDALGPHRWLERSVTETLDINNFPQWFDWSLDVLQEAQSVLTSWVTEILCDLHAVRRFGPAGLASIAEFLISIGALNNVSKTHPPACFRIYCMSRLIEADAGAYNTVLRPWREFQDHSLSNLPGGALANVLAQAIVDHFSELSTAAERLLAVPYDWRGRQQIALGLSANFISYIPAVNADTGDAVTHEDILNGGWLARAKHELNPDRHARTRALEMLDRLVAKALDDLDFVSLWDQATEVIAEVGSEEPELPIPNHTNESLASISGVLSAHEITNRIRSTMPVSSPGQPTPLIITPLFSNSARGAALDVRLSTKFIAFRRSGTPMFDSLDRGQDPREMQELVEKDWAGQFILHPLELVLASTLEYIVMPPDLTAQVVTRSSHGRLGLLSATAVLVHPNFKGCLTLELVNLGQMPLALTPGERIAQLVFYPVTSEVPETAQKYEYPTGPEFSLVYKDRDITRLAAMRKIRGASRSSPLLG
jgi:deoxycytidine triphosphate deaminase